MSDEFERYAVYWVPAGAQMHVDPAAAGAHVAGGLAHLVRDMRAGVEFRFRSVCHSAPLSSALPQIINSPT